MFSQQYHDMIDAYKNEKNLCPDGKYRFNLLSPKIKLNLYYKKSSMHFIDYYSLYISNKDIFLYPHIYNKKNYRLPFWKRVNIDSVEKIYDKIDNVFHVFHAIQIDLNSLKLTEIINKFVEGLADSNYIKDFLMLNCEIKFIDLKSMNLKKFINKCNSINVESIINKELNDNNSKIIISLENIIESNTELFTNEINALKLANNHTENDIENFKNYYDDQVNNFGQIIKDVNRRLSNLESSNLELQNENKLLKEKIRTNEIELHYLKSTNNEKIRKYNYEEIKNRNKELNKEFKCVAKLMRLNYN
jgi:hypothetical protein